MFVYNDKTMKLLYDVARPLQSMIRMVTSIYHPNANINRLRKQQPIYLSNHPHQEKKRVVSDRDTSKDT